MRVLIVGAKPVSLIKFRGELLKSLLDEGHEVIAMADASDKPTSQALAQLGVGFQSYHVQRSGLNPVSDARTCYELYRAMKRIQPDVILAYTVKPVVWGGLAARLYGKARFYPLITGLGYAFNQGGRLKSVLRFIVTRLYTMALSGADKVIFQNQDNLNLFVNEEITVAPKCFRVGGSGVDLSEYCVSELPPHPPIVFLCIARLLIDKGIREYAEAARQVREKYKNTKFLLVGVEDPSPNRIDPSLIEQWRSAGDVEYLGGKADVRPVLDLCHVYVLPSYHEGLPRTVLEAMAKGRPIITTDAVGCRDTVVPGENGLLVDPANVDSLVAAIEWFIENDSEWKRMSDSSRALVEEKFDVHKVNQEIINIMGLK